MKIYVLLPFLGALALLVFAFQIYRVDIRREYCCFLPAMISAAAWALLSSFWLLTSVEVSELMKGEIGLTSTPGVGSTFTVTIPVG